MAKFKVKDLFSKETHLKILRDVPNDREAALVYNCYLKGHDATISSLTEEDLVVSRQLVRYWRKIFIENDGKQTKANNAMKEQRKLIQPSPTDDIGETHVPHMARRILVIGDLHTPYNHKDAMAFLESVRDSYNPDIVVCMGDETDGHAISFHDSDPNLDSAGIELEKAKIELEKLHNLFPEMLICDSNHGSLVYRRAKAHGLPVQFIKKYRDILFPEHGAPGWSWADAWVLNTPLGKVRFQHQVSGDFMINASHERTSLVLGHEHGRFEVQYAASSSALYFGAYAGCLIDRKSLAFAYGKLHRKKPILGCMVITDGNPQLIPMLMDEDGNWVGK